MRSPAELICECRGPSAAQVRRTDETQSRPRSFPWRRRLARRVDHDSQPPPASTVAPVSWRAGHRVGWARARRERSAAQGDPDEHDVRQRHSCPVPRGRCRRTRYRTSLHRRPAAAERQPTNASKHAPGSQPPHMRTPCDLYCGTRGAVCARLARWRRCPSHPGGPVHRIRSHAEA